MNISGKSWTADAPLPGGDIPDADFARFLWDAGERHMWMPPEMLLRLGRAYGTRIDAVVGSATSTAGLGEHFGGDLYEAELEYLVAHEFAREADDVLWRRSKLGMHLSDEAAESVARWFAERP